VGSRASLEVLEKTTLSYSYLNSNSEPSSASIVARRTTHRLPNRGEVKEMSVSSKIVKNIALFLKMKYLTVLEGRI
jgi:hypothetical protein